MRNLPILTIRGGGNSSIAENPRTVRFLRDLRSGIADEPTVRGDLISARVERISGGFELTASLVMSGMIEVRLSRGGRNLVLRAPDPFMTGMSSRSADGDLPATIGSTLDMVMDAIDADLIPAAERDALDERRHALSRAIAARVAGANQGIDLITVRPPGPVDDSMTVHAGRGSEDAVVPLGPAHMEWMPIRCIGIDATTTASGLVIAVRGHAGSLTMTAKGDPVARMRAIGEGALLPDAPEPVVPESAWRVVF